MGQCCRAGRRSGTTAGPSLPGWLTSTTNEQEEAAMFIQVISGTTNDREGLRRQSDRWNEEVRPGAAGFLGSTSGVTDDGRMIAVVRFESEEAARRNSARDEQGSWWAETEKYLEGVTFKESTEITTMLGGASNRAGFV